MNEHTAGEHVAAIALREHAALKVAGYTKDPGDLAAARLAVLMVACREEAREQGLCLEFVFNHEVK